jgi:hypothetical protein
MSKKSDKVNMQKRVQDYFDSRSDDPVLEGFDNFFVGDEAESLMNRGSRRVHNFQGMAYEDVKVEMIDDLDEFAPKQLEICTNEEALLIFREVKGSIFSVFGFVELKSKDLSHPVREEDLIVTEDDHHLIAYLVTLDVDIQTIRSIASFSAFKEMGVLFARFTNECECPICKAFNGKIFNISEVLETLCSGGQLTHRGCNCKWVPIFDRNQEYIFKIDIEAWEKFHWYDVPVEIADEVRCISIEGPLHFTDISQLLEREGADTSLGFPVVFRAEDNSLYVHNGYIDGLGPPDFLREFVSENSVDDLTDREIFLYKGKRVYSKNGLYYDVETGEVL